ADYRRLARQISEALKVVLAVLVFPFAGRVIDPVNRGAAVAVKALEGRLDIGWHCDPRAYRLVESEFERPSRPVVERIGHREHQGSLALCQWDHAGLLEECHPDAPDGDSLARE